jgi:hypothetical protein
MSRLYLLSLLLFPLHLLAQETNVGAWYQYFGNQSFKGRWNLHNEFQYRNYNLAGDLEQAFIRVGVGYNLSEKNNNVLLGYGFFYSEPYVAGTDEKTQTRENRIFQQFLTRQQFNRVFLQHRYRIEERFIGDDFKWRFRYGLFFQLPFNKPGLTKGAVYLSLSNELFLQPKSPVFDRDRIYGALGYAFSDYIRMEAGYMVQVYESSHRGQLQLGIYNNTPFRTPAEQ